MFWQKPLDLLCIGDITIDAFIRIKDAHLNCTLNHEACEICFRFADKVPYESMTEVPGVGNSANAAVSASRLGLRSGFIGIVGDDRNGALCIDTLKKEGVDVSYLRRERGIETNYHYVLWYEADRTILVKHHAYQYALPKAMRAPKWLYLSSLGENSLPYHREIAAYLRDNPDVKLAFQPGTFQMKLGTEALKDIYARTEVFVCNKEEAQRILNVESADIKELLAALRSLGPRIAIVTDGRNGATAQDPSATYHIPMYPDRKEPYERTGAGDAFASTVVSALIAGLPLSDALTWGPVNSMAVVEEIGAQEGLLRREALTRLLAAAPSDYRVSSL
jgi:ribokinase